MPRRRHAELSDAFLKRGRARLDAIGPWEVEADADNLALVWRHPPALGGSCELRFQTDSDSPTFDPDERMFELWEVYRRHHARVAARLRAELGPPALEAHVEVRRGVSEDGPFHEVRVIVPAPDGEHVRPFLFDPETGRLEDE